MLAHKFDVIPLTTRVWSKRKLERKGMVRGASYKLSWSKHKYWYTIHDGAKIMHAFTTTIIIVEPINFKDKNI